MTPIFHSVGRGLCFPPVGQVFDLLRARRRPALRSERPTEWPPYLETAAGNGVPAPP
jgi:hypothetical protein